MGNSTHLHKIKIPEFGQNFGSDLTEQFKHIDDNFHKLAALKMYAGEDGKSAIYIVYNLNAILFYPSVQLDATTKASFDYRRNIGKGTASTELAAKVAKVEEELRKDYEKYHELTGKNKTAYASECWALYFGTDQNLPNLCLYDATYAPDENSIYHEIVQPGTLEYTGKPIPLSDSPGTTITIPTIKWEHSICGCIREQYAITNRMEMLASTPYKSSIDNKIHWKHATWLMDWALAKNASEASAIFVEHFLTYDPGKITVACTINDDSSINFVGSLPYMHIDPRFRNTSYPSSTDLNDEEWEIITRAQDITCVVYSEPIEKTLQFNVTNPFPQLYLGTDGQWYWSINGEKSNIPAAGPAGEPGKNTQFVVVERMEQLHYFALGRKGRPYVSDVLSNNGEINLDLDQNLSNILPHPIVAGYPYIDYSGPIGIAANINQIRGGYNINALNEPAEDADFWPLFRPYYNASEQEVHGKGWAQQYSEKFSTDQWNNLDSKFNYRVFGIAGGNIFWREYAEGDDADKYKIKIYKPEYLAKINDDKYFTEEIGDDGKATGKLFEYYVDDQNYLMRRYDGESTGKYLYDLVPYAPGDDQAVYELMKSLDGCPCIVLPGQLYHKEHYQTTYWFSTLKLCPYDNSESPTRFLLTAYCSPENMFSTNLDEHSYAGLMMGLDVYEQRYNRFGALHNKPRGYMLPIGSRFIDSTALTDASKEYSAHIMYSDLGAWKNRQDKSTNGKAVDWKNIRTPELTSEWKGIFDKHTMHIGSVMDYRALNDANLNGPAVPGRPGVDADHKGVGDSANYDYRHNCLAELHIDEPVTITNFRDTYFKNILLDVESSLRVGNRNHANYSSQALAIGGIYVDGVLSSTQGGQGQAWYTNNGQASVHYPYSAAGTPVKNNRIYKTNILNDFTYIYPFLTPSTDLKYWNNRNTINSGSDFDEIPGVNFWSALFKHGLGAQFITSYNGIAIGGSSDQGNAFYGNDLVFSVDRRGNLQHLGTEWRSNTYTNWIWHTLWNDKNEVDSHVNKLQFMDNHELITKSNPTDYNHGGGIRSSYENIPGSVHTASRGFAGKLYGGSTKFGNQLYHSNDITASIDDICPITNYTLWADVLCNNAALINQGLSPMIQSPKHPIRYGALTTYGQYIGGTARRPLDTQTDEKGNIVLKHGAKTQTDPILFYELPAEIPDVFGGIDFLSKDDNDENKSKYWWKDSIKRSEIGKKYCDHYGGFPEISISNEAELLQTGIGLYVKAGAFFESDIFVNHYARFMGNVAMASNVRVGKNLDVNENVHVSGNTLIDSNLCTLGQVYVDKSISANQYFRKGAKHGQFLMADGRSTRGWEDQIFKSDDQSPREENELLRQDYDKFKADDGVKSPLVIDFGSVYRGARLGKFDIVRDVKLSDDYKIITTEQPEDPDADNTFIWFCHNPATSQRVTDKTFQFFKKTDNEYEDTFSSDNFNIVKLNAFCSNCMAYIHMSFPLDYLSKSGDYYQRLWGHKYRNQAYGIKISDRSNAAITKRENYYKTLTCNGFSWDLLTQKITANGKTYNIEFPKPSHNVQAFLPSLYVSAGLKHGGACYWAGGAERTSQFGVMFDITPHGQLRIVDSNAADALSDKDRIVTRDLWFVYPYEPKGYRQYMIFAANDSYEESPNETTSLIKTSNNSVIHETTRDIDKKIKNNDNDCKGKCIWTKTHVTTTPPSIPGSENDVWSEIAWTLYYNGINTSNTDEADIYTFYWVTEGYTPSNANTGDVIDSSACNKIKCTNSFNMDEDGNINSLEEGISSYEFKPSVTFEGKELKTLEEVLHEYIIYKQKKEEEDDKKQYDFGVLENCLNTYLSEQKDNNDKPGQAIILDTYDQELNEHTYTMVYVKPAALVAADIENLVTKVSATYGSLMIETDAYWCVFPIKDKGPGGKAVDVTEMTDSTNKNPVYAANIAPVTITPKPDPNTSIPDTIENRKCPGAFACPGTLLSDHNSNKQYGGYILRDTTNDQYYMISLERWGIDSNNEDQWKCVLTTDDILTKMWEAIKTACAEQHFKWETLNKCYGQGSPVSPITIKFANGIFVIQDIHGVYADPGDETFDEEHPSIIMYGFLRIFASQFKPLSGSHAFNDCYEVNTGIYLVFANTKTHPNFMKEGVTVNCPDILQQDKNSSNEFKDICYAGGRNIYENELETAIEGVRTSLSGIVNFLGRSM